MGGPVRRGRAGRRRRRVRRHPLVAPSETLLEKVGLNRGYRQLSRDLASVLLVAATVPLTGVELTWLLVLPAAVWVTAVFSGALNTMIDRRNPVSALVRNIELGPIRSAPARPGGSPPWPASNSRCSTCC